MNDKRYRQSRALAAIVDEVTTQWWLDHAYNVGQMPHRQTISHHAEPPINGIVTVTFRIEPPDAFAHPETDPAEPWEALENLFQTFVDREDIVICHWSAEPAANGKFLALIALALDPKYFFTD